MAHRERCYDPQRIPPILPPVDGSEGEEKEDVVQGFAVHDVTEAELDVGGQFSHGVVAIAISCKPYASGLGLRA